MITFEYQLDDQFLIYGEAELIFSTNSTTDLCSQILKTKKQLL